MPRGRIANTLEDYWPYVSKLSKTECWMWTGTIHSSGYGTFVLNKQQFQAHRVAYFIANPGEIEMKAPADKTASTFVLHRCDVRPCCNPDHLFLGSIADNTRDMYAKGRGVVLRGEENPCSKFSNEDICDIRKMLSSGLYTQWDIARMYDVKQATISRIKLRQSYGDVE
jgi:hypothetical protein